MDGWWQRLVTEIDAKKRKAHAVTLGAGNSFVNRISDVIFTTQQQQHQQQNFSDSSTNHEFSQQRGNNFSTQHNYQRVKNFIPAAGVLAAPPTTSHQQHRVGGFDATSAADVTTNNFVNSMATPMMNRRHQHQQQTPSSSSSSPPAAATGGSQSPQQHAAAKRTSSDGNDRAVLNRLSCIQVELNQLDERIEYHVKIICLSRRASREASEEEELHDSNSTQNQVPAKPVIHSPHTTHHHQQQRASSSSLADERDRLFQLVARYASELDQIARKQPYATQGVPSTLALCTSPSLENLNSKFNFSNSNTFENNVRKGVVGSTSASSTSSGGGPTKIGDGVHSTPSTPPYYNSKQPQTITQSVLSQQQYKIGSVVAPSPVKREIIGMLDKLKARVSDLNRKLNYAANMLAAVTKKQHPNDVSNENGNGRPSQQLQSLHNDNITASPPGETSKRARLYSATQATTIAAEKESSSSYSSSTSSPTTESPSPATTSPPTSPSSHTKSIHTAFTMLDGQTQQDGPLLNGPTHIAEQNNNETPNIKGNSSVSASSRPLVAVADEVDNQTSNKSTHDPKKPASITGPETHSTISNTFPSSAGETCPQAPRNEMSSTTSVLSPDNNHSSMSVEDDKTSYVSMNGKLTSNNIGNSNKTEISSNSKHYDSFPSITTNDGESTSDKSTSATPPRLPSPTPAIIAEHLKRANLRQQAFRTTPTISVEFYDDFDNHYSATQTLDSVKEEHNHTSMHTDSKSDDGMLPHLPIHGLNASSAKLLLSPRKSVSSSRRNSATGLVQIRPNPIALTSDGLALSIPTLAVHSTPESQGGSDDDALITQLLHQQSLTPSPVGAGPGSLSPPPGFSMQRRRSSASTRGSCSITLLPSADAHLPHVEHPPLSREPSPTQEGPSVYVDGVHMLGTLIKQGVIVNADLIFVSLPTLGLRASLNDALSFGIVNAESVVRFSEPNEVIVSPATTPLCNAAAAADSLSYNHHRVVSPNDEAHATGSSNCCFAGNNNGGDDGFASMSSTTSATVGVDDAGDSCSVAGGTLSTILSSQGSSIESLQQQQQRSPSRMPEHVGIACLDTAIDQSWYDTRKSAFFDPNTLEQITFVEAVNMGIVDSDAVLVRDPRNGNVLSVIEALERVLMDKNTGHMVDPPTGKRIPLIDAVKLGWVYEGVKPVTLVEALQQGWHDSETGNFRHQKTGEPMTLHTAITSSLIDGENSRIVDPRNPATMLTMNVAIKQAIVDPWTSRVRNPVNNTDMSLLQAFEAGFLGAEEKPMCLYEVVDNGWYDPHSGRFLDPRMGDLVPLTIAIERGIIGQEAQCVIDSRTKETISLRQALSREIINADYAMYNIFLASDDSNNDSITNSNKRDENGNHEATGNFQAISLIEAMDAGLLLPVRDAAQQLGLATAAQQAAVANGQSDKRRRSHAPAAGDGYPVD